MGLDRPVGALVNRVEPGSAAEQAGIEAGDVILEVAGRPIEVFSDLPPIVGSIRPGEEIDVRISRWGDEQTLKVELAEREEAPTDDGRGPDSDATPTNSLGLTVEELTEAQRRQLEGVDGGVMITAVESDAAYRAGLRRGQVLQMINNRPIDSMDDFRAIVEDLEPGRSVAVLLWSNGASRFVAYTPEADR